MQVLLKLPYLLQMRVKKDIYICRVIMYFINLANTPVYVVLNKNVRSVQIFAFMTWLIGYM